MSILQMKTCRGGVRFVYPRGDASKICLRLSVLPMSHSPHTYPHTLHTPSTYSPHTPPPTHTHPPHTLYIHSPHTRTHHIPPHTPTHPCTPSTHPPHTPLTLATQAAMESGFQDHIPCHTVTMACISNADTQIEVFVRLPQDRVTWV